MIQGFDDYAETEVKTFDKKEKINLGGHICKILQVETETFVSKKDGNTYNMLKIKFDLEEPDEQAGFYGRRFAEDAKADALKAKWKGYHKVTIPNNTSADFIKSTWKTFLTSVEKSNENVKFDGKNGFEENLLIGKIFGGVFGLEEYELPTDGKKITFPRLRFIRSTESVNEAPIPKVKLLDGTYMDYEEYIGNKKEDSVVESNDDLQSQDDLPF